MVTREELAERLKTANVEALAREAGVSVKTVYRLRHQANSPSLDTVAKLLAALEKLQAEPLTDAA